jgi:ribosomal protein L12E/L44/L45/RPP1/RPP2
MSTEFVKQSMRDNLTRVLVPHVSDGLWSIYDNAVKACERNGQMEKTLQTFQNLLTRVPQWNTETLDKEVDRIIRTSKCDYIEDLLLGVFVSYIRAFASLQQSDATHVNIEFERPSVSKFIHSYYIACARKCWSQAYLFKTIGGVSAEQQARNRRDIDTLLEVTVGEVIDSFIPWREISRAYFHAPAAPAPAPAAPPVTFEEKPKVLEFETDDEEEEEEEEEDEERPKISLGEDIKLDDEEDDDKVSVSTEDELLQKAGESEVVALNL